MKILGGVILVVVLSACSDQDGAIGGGAGAGGKGAGGAGGMSSAGSAGRIDHGDAGAAGDSGAGGGAGDSGAGGDGGAAGSAGDAGAGGDAGAAGAGNSVAIWDEHSTLLHVTSGDFFSGYFGYQRTRAQLSTAQLDELARMRTKPQLDGCLEDGLNVVFKVTDDNAHTIEFRNDSCNANYQVVDPEAAQHFVSTLPCVLSKNAKLGALSTAPQVEIGDGCENGLFTGSGQAEHPEEAAPQWLRVHVATAHVPVVLQLADCGQRTFKLELMNEAGDAVLATGVPSGQSCQALSYSFETAGSYPVRVSITGGTGAGDLTFRAN